LDGRKGVAVPEWLRIRRSPQQSAEEAAQWTKCPKCSTMLYRPDLAKNLYVCTTCQHHFRMHAFDRVAMLVDGDFTEIGADVMPGDPLGWTDKVPYPQKLQRDREKSKLTEGVVCGFASIGEFQVALGVMDFNFRGGTMGTVVGERLARLLEEARDRAVPCILCTASGGARMEEGMLALMQMAKTTLALDRFRNAGGYAITVLTDPTTGGVSASFAFQTDVIVAESKAAIGFAGRRVIEQTIRQKLPENFQTAEFLLEHGAIDMVVDRKVLRDTLVRLLDYGVGAPASAPAAPVLNLNGFRPTPARG
jgi:acetyl-CoA carboxylase carboxyl transferase subunit beta